MSGLLGLMSREILRTAVGSFVFQSLPSFYNIKIPSTHTAEAEGNAPVRVWRRPFARLCFPCSPRCQVVAFGTLCIPSRGARETSACRGYDGTRGDGASRIRTAASGDLPRVDRDAAGTARRSAASTAPDGPEEDGDRRYLREKVPALHGAKPVLRRESAGSRFAPADVRGAEPSDAGPGGAARLCSEMAS